MSRRIAVLAAALAATAALPTASAFATEAWVYDKSRVLAHGWAPAGGSAGRAAVKDHWRYDKVKNEYNRVSNGSHKFTLWNKLGAGRTTYTKNGARVTKIHVCEEHNWAPDWCSKWVPVK
ncbi:hypothetical protein [Actinomadura logoneensis]|uniref:hypothetical protein n=1 Tax=Actinomadura logoneensis TaxID=2293572 RepID=UPI0011C1B497|nr:hypothetical protein [Actinomadura logoneensis]